MAGSQRLQTIVLKPQRDYQVIRGWNYENHRSGTCAQCQAHPFASDESWGKSHVLKQSGRTRKHSMAFSAPPIELYLVPMNPVHFSRPPVIREGFGDFWSDIGNFFASIINSILDWVVQLLKKILYDLLHPLQLLKDLVQLTVDFMTGEVFLNLFASFPLTRWLFQGLDYLTGGFLTNLTTMLSLPGKFLTGQTITRAMLLTSLNVLISVMSIAIAYLTGGALLAIIGGSVQLLKGGPLGKTALGRTLLDIAGIGMSAVCGGADLVAAFVNAGASKLEGTAIGALAQQLHLSGIVAGIFSAAGGAAAGAAGPVMSTDSGSEAVDLNTLDNPPDAAVDLSTLDDPTAEVAVDLNTMPASDASSMVNEAPSVPSAEVPVDLNTMTSSDAASATNEAPSVPSAEVPVDLNTMTSSDAASATNEEPLAPEDEGEDSSGDTSSDTPDNSTAIQALKDAMAIAKTAQVLTAPKTSAKPLSPVPSALVKKPPAPLVSAKSTLVQALNQVATATGSPLQNSAYTAAGLGVVLLLMIASQKRKHV